MNVTLQHIESIVMDGSQWNVKSLIAAIDSMGNFSFPIKGVESFLDVLTDQGKLIRSEDLRLARFDGYLIWQRNPNYAEATDGGLGRLFV